MAHKITQCGVVECRWWGSHFLFFKNPDDIDSPPPFYLQVFSLITFALFNPTESNQKWRTSWKNCSRSRKQFEKNYNIQIHNRELIRNMLYNFAKCTSVVYFSIF